MDLNNIEIERVARDLALRSGLTLVVLFGSRATGHMHAHSDTDIAVLGEHPFSPREIAACAYEFSVLLKRPNIEVADIRTAQPLLMNAIARGMPLFERDAHAFSLFQMYAFKRFVEAKPLRDLRYASLKQFATSAV